MGHHFTRRLLAALLLAGILVIGSGCQRRASSPATTTPGTSAGIVTTPIATTGCGQPPLATPGTSADFSLSSGGYTRTYRLHVPLGYQANQMTPLLLIFHGHFGTSAQVESDSRFSPLADSQGFLVAYPQGIAGRDGEGRWNTGEPGALPVNDVLFVSDLVTALQQSLCVDRDRIFAGGISNGGGMTGVLACDMASRLAAFAPISGAFYPIAGGCHPSRPVPMLEFHGTADTIVPYNGNNTFPPIPQWLQDWATRDGCASGPTTFFQQNDVTGEQWSACQQQALVTHYRIQGGGHGWPGGAKTSATGGGVITRTISATSIMWQFFQAHPLNG